MPHTPAEFDQRMSERGWLLFERVVDPGLVARMKSDLGTKLEECRTWRDRNAPAAGADGAAHHVLGGGTSLDAFFAMLPLDEYITRWFDGFYILNSFGASVNRRGNETSSYLNRMHRDLRSHTGGYRLLLNMLVLLDDFTLDNGATYLLSGSHLVPEPPDPECFARDADRLLGPAGSIALFDSGLWHAAGANRTAGERAALTLTFSRPFFKQQMDYPRFLGDEYIAHAPDRVRRVLGYYARTPCSYDEWYQPREKRFYRADQG